MNTDDNKPNKTKLHSLLDQYDNHVEAVEKKKEKEEDEREEFVERFIALRDRLIKPIFEDFKVELEKRGHKANIEIKERSQHQREPVISFSADLSQKQNDAGVYRPTYSDRNLPNISFTCISSEKKILSAESTIGSGHGGHSGSKNRFTLEQLTQELVENEFVEWLENLMKDAGVSNQSR